jgi:hypothetical protein
MQPTEKIAWLQVLLWMWGAALMILTAILLTAQIPLGEQIAMMRVIAWMGLGFTLFYLLILSWRAAYLSGRGK